MSRRDVLRWTAFAIASGGAAPYLASGSAGASALSRSGMRQAGSVAAGAISPVNLELVTLAEDRVVLTWYTGAAGSDDGLGRLEALPADAEVAWGTDPARLDQIAGSSRTDTPYHQVEISGLEPGRTYYYQARSGGQLAVPTEFTMIEGNAANSDGLVSAPGEPFRFTTPQPPPGKHLFTIALCNDTHLGETVAGLVGSIPGLDGIRQVDGQRPYPTIMTEALVAEAQQMGALYLLAAGDITAEAVPEDVTEARELFERFGIRQQDWFAARGNHDRAHDGPEWSSCSVGAWQGFDCFADQFFPAGEQTYFANDLHGLKVIGLDTYDKAGNGGDAGALSADQMEWFIEELNDSAERPTLVFGHHPLMVEASPYPSSGGDRLDPAQAEAITAAYRANPGVFLHHAGHTHRNRRSELAGAPGVVHQEVAAVKEFPGGYTLMRVHEGGCALNFHKLASDEARAWSERSRMQIAGTWPQFSLGARVSDRNVMVERDLSGLAAPKPTTAPTTVPASTTTPNSGTESDDSSGGGSGGAPIGVIAGVGGVVAVGAAATAIAARRRAEEQS